MRILLVAASHEIFVMSAAPLGLAYLAACLRLEGHKVEVADASICVKRGVDARTEILRQLDRFDPELVLCSIRNLDWTTWPFNIFSYRPAEALIRAIRARTHAPIVLGGPGFTVCSEAILRELGPGYLGVIGEGEEVVVQIARTLELGGDPHRLTRGITYLDDSGHLVQQPFWRVSQLESLPFPARDLLDNSSYTLFDGRPIANLQTSRGCARDCVFCTYPHIEGRALRRRTARSVVAELREVTERFGIHNVFFVDNVFNQTPDHVRHVCEEIVRSQLDVAWGANVRVDAPAVEAIPLMKQAGCAHISIGADALTNRSLQSLRKGTTTGLIRAMVEQCRRLDIEVFFSVFVGNPGETMADAEMTLQTLETMEFPKTSWEGTQPVLIQCGLRVYPHTPLQTLALAEGAPAGNEDLLFPQIYLSPAIEASELLDMVQTYLARHPTWFCAGLPQPGTTSLEPLILAQLEGYRDSSVILNDLNPESLVRMRPDTPPRVPAARAG